MGPVAVDTQILKTKLYPPRLPEIVARERLLAELDKARSSKLAAIVAGAGYGKSTLAAEFLKKLGSPFVWYQLEDTDSDLSVFLLYLIAGLRVVHPEFGEKTLSHMGSASNILEQSRAILSTFIIELDELIAEEVFIALDDFHMVNDSAQITEAMDFLLDHMLPNLHFIILSRSALSLEMSHLRARRELRELSEDDLSFTPEETGKLFSEVFGVPLAEQDIAALASSTEGWVAGQVLFYIVFKGKSSDEVSRAVRNSGASLSAVFDYLSKAAYDNQPEPVRDFITKTSVLSRMNPGFCDELLGISNSRAILSRLIEDRLFTIPLDDTGSWYRYHHGLRALLQNIMKENLPPDEINALHLEAASLWEKNGEPEEALSHYMEAENYDESANILEGIFAQLLSSNRLTLLDRLILRLPEEVLQRRPMLMLLDTQVASQLGDYDRVMAGAQAAANRFEETGEADKLVLALVRLAQAYFVTGKLDEAGETASRVREALPPGTPYRYELASTEAMIAAFVGQAGEADLFLDEVFTQRDELAGTEPETRTLAYCALTLLLQGKLNRALEIFLEVDRLRETTGLSSSGLHILYGFASRAYSHLDRLYEAVETAGNAVILGEKSGIPPMVFLNRAARAVGLACLGEHDRALEDASIAAEMCDKYGLGPQLIYTEWFLGEAYGLIGDGAAALKHLRKTELLLESYGDAVHIVKLLAISFSVEELGLEKAIEEVEEILGAVRLIGMGLARSIACSLLFTLRLEADRLDEARAVLETYLAEFGDDIILRSHRTDLEYLLPFFTDLFSGGERLELMERVYGTGGTKSVPFLKKLEKSGKDGASAGASELLEAFSRQTVEPLEIRMLGSFQVSRGGQVLSTSDWKSKKALTVFKYLALNREDGFIPRDVLMELVWPDVPPDSAAKSLNAALTSLRRTLEPGASRGESSYLVSKGDSLLLELGTGGWTDLELFHEKVSRASAAREAGDFDIYFRTLKEAEELYRGALCCEDLYEDWCRFEREELEGSYVDLVVSIATELLRRGEGTEALSHLEKAINKDPGREELYRRQMIIYSQMGNRSGIESAFKRCKTYLEDSYEVSPSQETTELYQKLRKE
jgi:ATP/maltotriose-dependent transcriptional regulator MalT/DNA-binding SARP family transcriptional activator